MKEHGVPSRRRSRAYTSYDGRHLPSSYSLREGELDLVVNGFTYTITIQQKPPQSTDPEGSKSLVIELGYSRSSRQSHCWADHKRWVLEDILEAVLRVIATRAVEDAQRKADEDRTKAEREVHWQAAMGKAMELAAQEQYAAILRAQAQPLTGSGKPERVLQHPGAPAGRGGRGGQGNGGLGTRVVGLGTPTRSEPRPTYSSTHNAHRSRVEAEELSPHLNGWSPHGLEAHRGWESRQRAEAPEDRTSARGHPACLTAPRALSNTRPGATGTRRPHPTPYSRPPTSASSSSSSATAGTVDMKM